MISPDTIIPDPGKPITFDRYAYARNNPVRYNDPTGHDVGCSGYDANRCEGSYNNLNTQLEKRRYTVTPVVRYIFDEMVENSNGAYARNLRDLNASGGLIPEFSALEGWAEKVAPERDWDHKPYVQQSEDEAGRLKDYQEAGTREYHFDTWSNIHYGYVGNSAGFSDSTLLDGAGAAQALDDLRKGKELTPDLNVNGLRKYDQLQDRVAIQIGIDLWQQYGNDLQPEDIIWAIESASYLQVRP